MLRRDCGDMDNGFGGQRNQARDKGQKPKKIEESEGELKYVLCNTVEHEMVHDPWW